MRLIELILASAIATAGGMAITKHFENIGKERIVEVREEKKENLLDKVAEYIQNEYASYWINDGKTLNYERAYNYAKWI